MSIKSDIIGFLERSPVYYSLKYNTFLYSIHLALRPNLRSSIVKEKALYSSLLRHMPKNAIIFDIGASVGNTTLIFAEMGAKVVAIEPGTNNGTCLNARFKQNKAIRIVKKAISSSVNKAFFHEQQKGNTLHTLSTKWRDALSDKNKAHFKSPSIIYTTTLDELIKSFGLPYFIKIDIEGFEWEAIQGLNQSVPIIVFEANLPEFLQETILCVQRLFELNQNIVFNYSVGASLVLKRDLQRDDFIDFLRTTPLQYLDIVCKQ